MMNTSVENVRRIMERLGIEVRKVRGNSIKGLCPLHQEKTPSFSMLCGTSRMPRYHCFGCGASGSLMHLYWVFRHRLSIEERSSIQVEIAMDEHIVSGAKRIQAEGLVYVPFGDRAAREYVPMPVRDSNPSLTTNHNPGTSYRNVELPKEEDLERFSSQPMYMIERGFDSELLEEYEVRDDISGHRAIFVIRDWSNTLQGWSARTYWNRPICRRCNGTNVNVMKECPSCGYVLTKYKHTTNLDRNNLLYGESHYQAGTLPLLVEGFVDVLRPVQYGIKQVATPLGVMGNSPGESQIRRLLRQISPTLPIAVMGDNDKAGAILNSEVDRILREIEPYRRLATVMLPNGTKDPGEMTAIQVGELVVQLEGFRENGEHRQTIQLTP